MEVFNKPGKVRLMFQDEAGFGRINKPKYCWCRPGVEYCVSDIRQSQEWHCRNRAEKGLNALLTSAPEAQDGMRASA